MTKYLQFISDIHLIFPQESYLALLGDIGYPHLKNYDNFLKEHAPKFTEILLLAGNHEYYSTKKKQI